MKLLTLFTIASFLCITNVEAKDAIQSTRQLEALTQCQLQETANITISFNGQTADIAKISNLLDVKAKEVIEIAKENGVETINVSSKNMNINNNGNNNIDAPYQYNGSISFNVTPVKKSYELLDLLRKKNYDISLNANSYNNGGCQH